MSDFLCIGACDLGYLGLISLTFPNSTDTKIGINWLSDGFYIEWGSIWCEMFSLTL